MPPAQRHDLLGVDLEQARGGDRADRVRPLRPVEAEPRARAAGDAQRRATSPAASASRADPARAGEPLAVGLGEPDDRVLARRCRGRPAPPPRRGRARSIRRVELVEVERLELPASRSRPPSTARPRTAGRAPGRAVRAARAGRQPTAWATGRGARLSRYGARWTPRSVMIAVTIAAGVTSKAGFATGDAGGADAAAPSRRPRRRRAARSGCASPLGERRVDRRGRARRRRTGSPWCAARARPGRRCRSCWPRRRWRRCGRRRRPPRRPGRARSAGPPPTSAIRVCGMPSSAQLPGGQPGALQERAGLVDPDVDRRVALVGAPRITPSAVP